MKRRALICCALSCLPVIAYASSHFASGAGGRYAPRSSIGIKYGTSAYGTTYSTLTSGERIGVNCATDRQCLLIQLRNQGLELREKDGGKLTPAHRAELQALLDSINGRL